MIDQELVELYIRELEELRVHGRRFAESYPDIARRLDIGARASRDPHVERVVESAAFLAARLRLMLVQNQQEFPLSLLTMMAPTLVEPTPSMTLIQLQGGRESQHVARDTRFEYQIGGQTQVCFSTTMAMTVAPVTLRLRRLDTSTVHADGIGVTLVGTPDRRLVLCLGNNGTTAATLLDALSESLAAIEFVPAGGGNSFRVARSQIRIHGFDSDEAMLPMRPATHQAHRLLTEFMAFPEKFRFVSLSGLPFASGAELRFWFLRPLQLPAPIPPDLITTNRVPAINLWKASATPFNVDGKRLEYPIRVDALRYRTVECHSVESVDIHSTVDDRPLRIDPVVGFGNIRGTTVRWGARRRALPKGSEMLLYFQGLDYGTLGRSRLLAAPKVLASNRDIAQSVRNGSILLPTDGVGNWSASLAMSPSSYLPARVKAQAMEVLMGHMRSSMRSLAEESRQGMLRRYLRLFPASGRATWIDGLGGVAIRPTAAMRRGQVQPGETIVLSYDGQNYPTTSKMMLRRVLSHLFDSQRGLNRVEEMFVNTI